MSKLAPVQKDGLVTIEPESHLELAKKGLLAIVAARDALVTFTYEAQENLKVFKKFAIKTQDDLNDAEAVTIDVKKDLKRLEAQRDAALAPLKELSKLVSALYTPAVTSLKASEKELKTRIARGIEHLRDEQNRALKAVSTLTSIGRVAPARQVLLGMPDAQLPSNTSIREIWKFRVKNAELVPDAFLTVVIDSDKVEEAIDAGVRHIEGLEIYKEDSVTIRTK